MAAEKLPAFTKVINPYFELYDNHPPAKRPRSGTHPALPSDEWKSKFSARLLELRKVCLVLILAHQHVDTVALRISAMSNLVSRVWKLRKSCVFRVQRTAQGGNALYSENRLLRLRLLHPWSTMTASKG